MLSALHAYIEQNVTGVLQPEELLRAEWVARVSALDLYIHELIAQLMVEIFETRRTPTPAYQKFGISSDTMNRIRTATSAAEASAAYDLHVREQLGRVTYQFPDDIANGIRLISAVQLWNEVAGSLGATSAMRDQRAKAIKLQLSLIVRRRNAIAHEGDLQRTQPRETYPISKADLQTIKDFIEKVVRAINTVIMST